MQVKSRVLFYGNSNHDLGAGHIMRLYALAQSAQERFDIVFVYKECPPSLIKKLRDEGFETRQTTSPLNPTELTEMGACAVFVDDYYLTSDERRAIASIGLCVVVLDDALNTDTLLADIVVNPAPNVNVEEYRMRAPMATFCFGPQFTYLRREFASCNYVPIVARDNILITLGGTDSKSLALPLCKILLTVPNEYNLQLLLGSEHQDQVELEQLQVEYPHFTIVFSPPSVAEYMVQAGLAVSAAGGTLGELASLGVPTLALVTVDNQLPALLSANTESWYRAIDVRNFNAADEMSQQNIQLLKIIRLMVDDLWRNNCLREEMNQLGRQLVDPHGCQRVVDKLSDYLKMSFKSE